jgi:hypothetical protein
MAASGYTPIQLYYSTTPSAQPLAGDLVDGELAINVTTKNFLPKTILAMYFCWRLTHQVQRLFPVLMYLEARQVYTTSGGPITTSGIITIAGTLAVANGGTGATTDSGARQILRLRVNRYPKLSIVCQLRAGRYRTSRSVAQH